MNRFLGNAWVVSVFGVLSGFGFTAHGSPPQIVSTNPPNGAVGVRPDLDRIHIRFDRPITWGEGTGCLEVSNSWENVGVAKWEDDVIHIVRQGTSLPDLPLGSTHLFVLNPVGSDIPCFLRDLEGNPLPRYELTFKIKSRPDEPPIEPQIVSTYPEKGSTGVDPNIAGVSVTFNKPMDGHASVMGVGFGPGTTSWSDDMRTWRFIRDSSGTPLPSGVTVFFILNPDYSDRFRDTGGNVLQESTFWFTVQGDREAECEQFYNVEILRFEANPAKGFHWPYYLSVPRDIQSPAVMMVGPNNSGFPALDQAWHDYKAKVDLYWLTSFVWKLDLPVLVPTFPRPPDAYIQPLEGWAFWQNLPPDLQRIDLQLLAMIQEARNNLQSYGIVIQDRVFITGFSASGAFASNFTVLHPEFIKACAAGGIGWRCVPVSSWDTIQQMSYPMGVANLESLTGQAFDLQAFKMVPQYFFAGDQDTTGYIMVDALDMADRERFRELIGAETLPLRESLLKGWALNQAIHDSVGTGARFVIYPGVGHHYTDPMTIDIQNFFRKNLSIQTAYPSFETVYTLTGDSTSARFYGGVTSDGGGSFRNQFSVSETIRILMTIGPDFDDVDWPGTIYVMGALNGTWFCLGGNGAWSPWDGTLEGLAKTYRREKLTAVEPVDVATFALNGLEGANFQILTAYANSTGKIYYHWPPLSFTVTP